MGINQIVKFNLEKRAHELRSSIDPVRSIRDIARILSDESGTTIHPNSVQRYFTTNFTAKPEKVKKPDPVLQVVQQRTEILEQAAADRLDAVQQLRDINVDTRAILNQLKDEKGQVLGGVSGGYLALAAIQRIEKQLELQAKLLGDLPSGPTVSVTIIEQQYADFRNILLEVTCPECRARIVERLHQVLGQ